MNRVLPVLLLSSFCLAVKGQSAFSVKDGFIYSNTVLYTDKALDVESMIDTGCSLCLIDSTFADTSGLNILNDEKQVVYGKQDGLTTCIVDSIEFCGKLYHKVPCLVADLRGIFLEYAPDFIVGGDILRDRPLKINRTSMMIEPFAGKHEKGSIIMKWKDYKSEPDIPALFIMFEAIIDGQKYNFAFDTGSKGNKLPIDIQLEPTDTIQRETADINNKLTVKQQKEYKNVNLRISSHNFEFDFFEGKKKFGLLSLDLVNGHSFILNYKDRTLEILQ